MRILLINPQSEHIVIAPPLGLLYLAAYIRKFNSEIDINILDLHLLKLDNKDILDFINSYKPDIVGIFTISSNAKNIFKLSNLIRPHIKTIVFGGPFATIFYNKIIVEDFVDYIIIGEGERPFLKLINCLINKNLENINKIDRLITKKNRNATYEAESDLLMDIENIPFPAWDIISVEKYFNVLRNSESPIVGTKRVLPIFTSRGCPFKCSYCHNIFGKKFRPMPAKRIIMEIEYLINNYNIEAVEIWDDVFNLDPKRLFDFCRMIKEKKININISFSNGIRADILTFEMIDKLIEAGAKRINFGIESGTKRIQHVLCKYQNLKKVEENVKYISKKHKIITGGFFILGNPGETKSEILRTINFASKLPLDIASFFACTPNPGTNMFKSLNDNQKQQILKTPLDKFSYHEVFFSICEISPKELKSMIQKAFIKFYSNPRRLIRLFRKIKFSDLLINGILLFLFIINKKNRLFYSENPSENKIFKIIQGNRKLK